MMEYETCYVFSPDGRENDARRPIKRRRTVQNIPPDPSEQCISLAPLLRGEEIKESIEARRRSFEAIWRPKEAHLNVKLVSAAYSLRISKIDFSQNFIQNANVDIISEITSFIRESDVARYNGKIATGLIVSGPDNSSFAQLLESIAETAGFHERAISVTLTSGQSINLKTALKYINQHATSSVLDAEDDDQIIGSSKGPQLNYDLQILANHVRSRSIDKVILGFEDSEAFDGRLLADLIELLSSWQGRIPFVLLFGVATSAELFQEKLSRDTVRLLQGTIFHVKRIDPQEMFRAIQADSPRLFLGPGLSKVLFQQPRDYVQSPISFGQSLKYAYMTHFFANPLSLLVDFHDENILLQKEHYEAIRHLASFRRYIQSLIETKDYDNVRDLLDDDEKLEKVIKWQLPKTRAALERILEATQILSTVQSFQSTTAEATWSKLYIQAMAGELKASSLLESILRSFKRIPSSSLRAVLKNNIEQSLSTKLLLRVKQDLDALTSGLENPEMPLRSQYDVHHETLRTTIVAQKVSLSKNASTPSAQDTAYTKIVDRAYDELYEYFQRTLVDPRDLFLHEVLIYDSMSPHRDVFSPRPRFAIERALSSPHDYLGCECCPTAGGGLSATAILYQLYLESGSAINNADLWSAFCTIICVEGVSDEAVEQQRALALFERGLAELQYLGMIKLNRKKVDHLTKLSWKGI